MKPGDPWGSQEFLKGEVKIIFVMLLRCYLPYSWKWRLKWRCKVGKTKAGTSYSLSSHYIFHYHALKQTNTQTKTHKNSSLKNFLDAARKKNAYFINVLILKYTYFNILCNKMFSTHKNTLLLKWWVSKKSTVLSELRAELDTFFSWNATFT